MLSDSIRVSSKDVQVSAKHFGTLCRKYCLFPLTLTLRSSHQADRRALINKIQEHVARLAPFILCAGQTSYDLASALKHRPAVLLPAITAINACPASIAETGGVLQAKLRTGFPFLDNNGSELDILRETVFQLIMAILNFNIHSDLLPHKDRKPDGVLFQESCRLLQGERHYSRMTFS